MRLTERPRPSRSTSSRLLIVLALLAAVGPPRAHGAPLLSGAEYFSTDLGSFTFRYGIVATELDGDGVQDLVVGTNYVTVLLGIGDGTMRLAHRYEGRGGGPLELGDVDGDGRLDVVALGGSSAVFVHLGQGDGTLVVGGSAGVSSANNLAVGDVDGDGRADVVVAGTDALQLMLAQPGGGLPFPATIGTGGADHVELADVDHDGHADLFALRVSDSTLAVYPGQAGGFGPPTSLSAPGEARDLRVTDTNGDGRFEVMVLGARLSFPQTIRLAFWQVEADGTIGPRSILARSDQGTKLAVGEFNANPGADVVLLGGQATRLMSQGAGPPDWVAQFGWEIFPNLACHVADVNADGRADLLTAGRGGNFNDFASVHLGRGDGLFLQPTQRVPLTPAEGEGRGVALGDLTGDGVDDLVTTSILGSNVGLAVRIASAPGAFGAPVLRNLGSGFTYELALGDLDADGDRDVLAAIGTGIQVLRNDGAGGLIPSAPVPSRARGIALGDVDEDGRTDFVPTQSDELTAHLSNGDGSFTSVPIQPPGTTFAGGALADFDHDGHLDLFVLDITLGARFLRGHGDGTFDAPVSVLSGFDKVLGAADCNGDGHLDVVVGFSRDELAGHLTTSLGAGDGTFSLSPKTACAAGVREGRLADVNADGTPDVVFINQDLGSVWVFVGNHDGTFTRSSGFGVSHVAPFGLAVGQLDAGGPPDVAVSALGSSSSSIGHGVTLLTSVPVPTHTITVSSTGPGSVVPSGTLVLGHGTSPTLRIAPQHDAYASVTVDGVSVGSTDHVTFPYLEADHTVEVTFLPRVVVEFDFRHERLRLVGGDVDRLVTAFLEPPPPLTADQVDLESLLLNGSLAPFLDVAEIGDRDHDGVADLEIAFSRSALSLLLPDGEQVVEIQGFAGSVGITGLDDVNVRHGRVGGPSAHEVLSPGSSYVVTYDPTPSGAIQYATLLHSLDGGDTWTIAEPSAPNTGAVTWAVPNRTSESARVAIVEVEDDSDPLGSVVGVLAVSESFSIQGALAVAEAPLELELDAVAPTPSVGRAELRFGLPRPGPARLDVFDAAGRRVQTLARGDLPAGRHRIVWTGRHASGSAARAGVYFVRLEAGGRELRRRIVWME